VIATDGVASVGIVCTGPPGGRKKAVPLTVPITSPALLFPNAIAVVLPLMFRLETLPFGFQMKLAKFPALSMPRSWILCSIKARAPRSRKALWRYRQYRYRGLSEPANSGAASLGGSRL
jgi:hypothetical protein